MKKGIYQHFKGQYYELIDVARHSETLEEVVVYRALYDKMELWIRPLKMFAEQIERNHATIPRFKFISNQTAKDFFKDQSTSQSTANSGNPSKSYFA